jgi:hypothetical protein
VFSINTLVRRLLQRDLSSANNAFNLRANKTVYTELNFSPIGSTSDNANTPPYSSRYTAPYRSYTALRRVDVIEPASDTS